MTKRETYISRQARRLSTGQIDRRRFVMSALASGVTMPTAMSLASRAEAAQPKAGGHLRFGLRSGFAPGSEGWLRLNRARGSTLVSLGDRGAARGDLAEHVESSEAGRVWTFALRPDVRFHSGRLVEARDVVDSLWAAVAAFPQMRGITDQIAGIEARQRHLRITLHHPHHRFTALLGDPHLIVLPSDDGRVDLASTDGTGLYRIDATTDGGLHLLRNRDHWSETAGHFESVTLRSLPDDALRQAAIMAGEVDVIDAVDPRALAMLSSLPGITIAESEGSRHLALDMHMSDPSLRAVLRAAMDRNALLERALLGHGSVGRDMMVREHPAPEHPPHPKAVPSGATLTVEATGVPGADRLLSALNAATATSGLHLAAAPAGETPSVTLRDHRLFGDEDAALSTAPPPLEDFADVYAETLKAARATPGAKARDVLLNEAMALQARHGRRLIPLWINDLVAHSARLTPHARHKSPEDVITRWWFA